MVLAVNWPPQAPADGQATRSITASASSRKVPGLMLTHGLEHVLHGDVLAFQPTRQDRARHR
jgi:hypothetical protein